MDFEKRILPTRDSLIKAHGGKLTSEELAAPDLVLTILGTADRARHEIYDSVQKTFGLSEGNISLLMALWRHGEVGVNELSAKIGIKPATASVMIKRMLARSHPLIELEKNGEDGRYKVVRLTSEARELIPNVLLPSLYREIRRFASPLSYQEQEGLISALKKLL